MGPPCGLKWRQHRFEDAFGIDFGVPSVPSVVCGTFGPFGSLGMSGPFGPFCAFVSDFDLAYLLSTQFLDSHWRFGRERESHCGGVCVSGFVCIFFRVRGCSCFLHVLVCIRACDSTGPHKAPDFEKLVCLACEEGKRVNKERRKCHTTDPHELLVEKKPFRRA